MVLSKKELNIKISLAYTADAREWNIRRELKKPPHDSLNRRSFFLQVELRDSYDLNDVCDSRWAAPNHSCPVIKAPACHMW